MAVTIPSIFEVQSEDSLFFVNPQGNNSWYGEELKLESPDTLFEQDKSNYYYRDGDVRSYKAKLKGGGILNVRLKGFNRYFKKQEDREEYESKLLADTIIAEATFTSEKEKYKDGNGYVTTSKRIAEMLVNMLGLGATNVRSKGYELIRNLMWEVLGFSPEYSGECLHQRLEDLQRDHYQLKENIGNAARF